MQTTTTAPSAGEPATFDQAYAALCTQFLAYAFGPADGDAASDACDAYLDALDVFEAIPAPTAQAFAIKMAVSFEARGYDAPAPARCRALVEDAKRLAAPTWADMVQAYRDACAQRDRFHPLFAAAETAWRAVPDEVVSVTREELLSLIAGTAEAKWEALIDAAHVASATLANFPVTTMQQLVEKCDLLTSEHTADLNDGEFAPQIMADVRRLAAREA